MEEYKNEFTPDLYTLVDDEGNEQTFEMLDALEQDGEKYYALVPYYENPEDLENDDGELVILKSTFEDDEEILATIDDDDEYDRIGAIFLDRLNEMFGDEDDDDADCGCGCHNHES